MRLYLRLPKAQRLAQLESSLLLYLDCHGLKGIALAIGLAVMVYMVNILDHGKITMWIIRTSILDRRRNHGKGK